MIKLVGNYENIMDFAEQTFHQRNPRQHKNSPGGTSWGCQQQMNTLSSQDAVWISSCFTSVVCRLDSLHPKDTSVSHVWLKVWSSWVYVGNTDMFSNMLAWMSWITAPQGILHLVCVHMSNNQMQKKSIFTLNHLKRIQDKHQVTTEQEKCCLKDNNRDARTFGGKWGLMSGY